MIDLAFNDPCFPEGLPAGEISKKLGVKVGTVRRIIYDFRHGNIKWNMSDSEKEDPYNKKVDENILNFINRTVLDAFDKKAPMNYKIL